jgi:subtilisin family serine protease
MTGTSMAAPFVSGAVALMAAKNSALTISQIKSMLIQSVDKLSQWTGKVASGGRLNLANALALAGGGGAVTPPPPTPSPTGTYQPDLMVGLLGGTLVGNNLYGVSQTVSARTARGASISYTVRLQNDGTATDGATIIGTRNTTYWTVKYYLSTGTDITSSVTGTGYRVASLAPGATMDFRVTVTPSPYATGYYTATVRATSTTVTTKSDTIQAITGLQ